MCKDRKKLSNTEQKITKCNRKVFHVEHCKCFTWNIASVSRGTPTAHRRGRLRSSSLLPPPCSGLRARLWAAAFGFGILASLAVLAFARFALYASSSCARLSCRHFYRHGGNAP